MSDLRDLLPLYALGALEPDEVARIDLALATDPALAAELAAFEEVASTMIAPVEPPPAVHTRLMASVGAGRFERFAAQIGRLYDVTVDRARELLGLTDRAASWEIGAPGVGLVHFSGGPACATADCGFIELAPGTAFPLHQHRGEEVVVILAGRLRNRATGQVYAPGDEVTEGVGQDHDVVCDGDEPCIYAARVTDGIEIGGVPARPPKK